MLLRQALSQLPGRAPVRAPHEADRVQSGNSRVEALMARVGELEAQNAALREDLRIAAALAAEAMDQRDALEARMAQAVAYLRMDSPKAALRALEAQQ